MPRSTAIFLSPRTRTALERILHVNVADQSSPINGIEIVDSQRTIKYQRDPINEFPHRLFPGNFAVVEEDALHSEMIKLLSSETFAYGHQLKFAYQDEKSTSITPYLISKV